MRLDMACDTGNTQPSHTGVLISVQYPAEGRAWLATIHPIKQLSHCVFWIRISSCPARANFSTAPRTCHSVMIFVQIQHSVDDYPDDKCRNATRSCAGEGRFCALPGRKSQLVDGKRLHSQKARLRQDTALQQNL